MNSKGGPRAVASAGLAQADKKVDSLLKNHLPSIPHILYVPTNTPYRPTFPYENHHPLFDKNEFAQLQYMTMISNGDRGVAATKGASDWEDEIYGSPNSAAGHNNNATRNGARETKKPSQKMSFGDYKNMKQTGVKPSPRPITTPEQRSAPAHSRNTSAVSATTSMDLAPSSHGLMPAVVNVNPVTDEKSSSREPERSIIPRSMPNGISETEKIRPTTNGRHFTSQFNTPKDSTSEPHATKSLPPFKVPPKHTLPPRPQSPPRSNLENKKRSLESGEIHPEKRAKIGHVESRTPSGSQSKDTSRRSEASSSGARVSSVAKTHIPSTTASPIIKKPNTSRPADDSVQTPSAKSQKPLDLPPILSPLPADLGPSPDPHASTRKSDPNEATPPKTPAKKDGSDTIVVKQPHGKSHGAPPTVAPQKPSKSFVLPPLLPRSLPSVVEEELLRLQHKSAALNTVEARHEKARLPDTKGVARKKPQNPKVGHPPKRTPVEKLPSVPEKEVKSSLIVKIPYKKRSAKDIQRILGMTQRPRSQMKKLEAAELLAKERSTSAAPPKDDSISESGEEIPLSRSKSSKIPSGSISRKRPSDTTDRSEPAPKRSKPEIDIVKAATPVTQAFNSPALSAPSTSAQKGLLATPKKGDAMKSATSAMRRVDSSEGLARTPQTAATSTPTSTEKARSNGIDPRLNHEIERLRAVEAQLYPLGTTLKRKMDAKVKLGSKEATDLERKLGFCIGVESMMAYMLAFELRDRVSILRSASMESSSWESFMKLQAFFCINAKAETELIVIIEQMGALAREMLQRTYIDQLCRIKDGKTERIAREMRDNSRAMIAAWAGVKRNENVLKGLGIKTEKLGPWSMIGDAVSLAGEVLTAFTKKEKLNWIPDKELSAARALLQPSAK